MRTLTEASAPLARRAERVIARIRVVGGAVGIALTLSEAALHPPLMYVLEQGLYAAAIVVGLVSLRRLDRVDTPGLERLMRWTFLADLLIIGSIEPSNAWVTGVLSSPAGILLPAIGGLKFGVPGARIATGAFVLSQVIYELLRTVVYGSPHSIENSVAVVVIGAVMGAMAGRLATDARTAVEQAERRTDAWGEANAQLEEANRRLGVVHRVILNGFGGDAATVVQRMVAELDHVPYIQVLLIDGDELRFTAGTSRTPVEGLDVALLRELDQTGSPTVLPISDPEAPEVSVAAVAPLHGHGQIMGALVLSGALDPRRDIGEALRTMQTLADQMGLAVQAARAYENEAAVAHRYQELDRLKTDFIALASHELRTPLTAVNGHAETLARLWQQLDPEVVHRLILGIQDHGHRLEQLVDDLTAVATLAQGEVASELSPVCAEEVAVQVIAGLEIFRDTRLETRGGTRALADAGRLTTCLEHLLGNAVRHGRPPIELLIHGDATTVRIQVRDDGDGIPADRQAEVFEPFVLAGDVLRHHRGSGLGLALVRRQVRAMGGTVELVDDGRRGATFVIELVAAPPLADPYPSPVSPRDRLVTHEAS